MAVCPAPSPLSARRARRAGAVTFREIGIALLVALLFIAVVTLGEPDFRPQLKLKNCIAHMGAIHQAATIALMESPETDSLTVEHLVAKGYLPRPPVCPLAADFPAGEMKYVVLDRPGQPLDIECVHVRDRALGHGSYLRLKEKYLDPPERPENK